MNRSKTGGGGGAKTFNAEIDLSTSQISKWQSLKNRLESGTLLKSLRGGYDHGGGGRGASTSSIKPNKFSSGATGTGGVTFNVKMLILEAKSRHDAAKSKQKERSERRHLRNKQIKLGQQLEYLTFPTIMGWYFGGFHTTDFKLNEKYATIFNELELEIATRKENEYKETFAEMAQRNFWPPHLINGFMFRTKGVYLDFKEILKDPPHTPPDLVTDRGIKAVTLYVNDESLKTPGSKVASAESMPINKVKMTVSESDASINRSKLTTSILKADTLI